MSLKELIERIEVFDDAWEVAFLLEPLHESGSFADQYAIRESQISMAGMHGLLVDIKKAYEIETGKDRAIH